jgi:hypothetical protein
VRGAQAQLEELPAHQHRAIGHHPKVPKQLWDLAKKDPSLRLLLSQLPDRETERIATIVIEAVA